MEEDEKKVLTRDELLAALTELRGCYDGETGHLKADAYLLNYINDPEITEAFERIERWYA